MKKAPRPPRPTAEFYLTFCGQMSLTLFAPASLKLNVYTSDVGLLSKCRFGSIRSEMGPRLCISNQFPGEADAVGSWTPL